MNVSKKVFYYIFLVFLFMNDGKGFAAHVLDDAHFSDTRSTRSRVGIHTTVTQHDINAVIHCGANGFGMRNNETLNIIAQKPGSTLTIIDLSGRPSNIQGSLRATLNLNLINPKGFNFGVDETFEDNENFPKRINVLGKLLVSTLPPVNQELTCFSGNPTVKYGKINIFDGCVIRAGQIVSMIASSINIDEVIIAPHIGLYVGRVVKPYEENLVKRISNSPLTKKMLEEVGEEYDALVTIQGEQSLGYDGKPWDFREDNYLLDGQYNQGSVVICVNQQDNIMEQSINLVTSISANTTYMLSHGYGNIDLNGPLTSNSFKGITSNQGILNINNGECFNCQNTDLRGSPVNLDNYSDDTLPRYNALKTGALTRSQANKEI